MVSEPEPRFYWYVLGTGNSEREHEKKKSELCSAGLGITLEDREGPARGCEEQMSILLLSLWEAFVEAA